MGKPKLICAGLLLLACSSVDDRGAGGSGGSGTGGIGDAAGGGGGSAGGCCFDRCEPEVTLHGLDDVLPGGFTAGERLVAVVGLRKGMLTWEGGSENVEVDPDTGATELEVELRYQDGPIEFLNYEACEHLTGWERGRDHLRVVARVQLRTADGALDESFPVIAITCPSYYWDMHPCADEAIPAFYVDEVDLSGEEFQGSFSTQSLDEGLQVRISLDALFDEERSTGSLPSGPRATDRAAAEISAAEPAPCPEQQRSGSRAPSNQAEASIQ
jgi:hypothetical protein